MTSKTRDRYEATSHRIRKEVLSLSVREEESLDDAGDGLAVAYELFYAKHPEQAAGDAYAGFENLMRQWPAPWKGHALFHSALPLHEYWLAWAWKQNDNAWFIIHSDDPSVATALFRTPEEERRWIKSTIESAKRSLAHADKLMAEEHEKLLAERQRKIAA